MSLVFETSRQAPYLGGEDSYPPIDQAGDEVERYDEEAVGNNVGVGMSDVGDVSELAVAVAGGYHAPDSSILESESSRLVVDEVIGAGEDHDHHQHQVSANIAAAAAAASAAAQSHAKTKASARRASDDASISPPHSLGEATSSIHGSAIGSRIKPIPKPDRDIYRNPKGKFQCTWPDCTEEAQEFSRKCEYNKHMDKHERPYRCTAEGCEKLPGFTYSGGLLRHEREVHNKHGGPRNPLHCPHPTCKRHAGKGFSRQENLNEHLRRVHTTAGSSLAGVDLPMDGSALSSLADLRPLAAVVDASGPGGNPATMSAAAVAAAAAAADVSEALPSSVMRGDENDDDRTMEGLELLTGHSQVQMHPRRRKRTASFLGGDEDDHGHYDLREEVKRVRLENEELRRQAELQKNQMVAMMKQITQLQQQQQQQQQQACKTEASALADALAGNCSPTR